MLKGINFTIAYSGKISECSYGNVTNCSLTILVLLIEAEGADSSGNSDSRRPPQRSEEAAAEPTESVHLKWENNE